METLFLGLAVPDSVAEALPHVWDYYGSLVATTTPRTNLHLTLFRLGDANDITKEQIKTLSQPLPQSFVPTMRLTHIGRGRQRQQLWAYGEAAGPLMALREQLIERLGSTGWSLPKQSAREAFTPHITVATLYEQVSHIGVADYPFITSYTTNEVLLYKSTPAQQGEARSTERPVPSVYSILERIPLT